VRDVSGFVSDISRSSLRGCPLFLLLCIIMHGSLSVTIEYYLNYLL